MSKDITDFRGSDTIDISEVCDRVDELREERADLQSEIDEADENDDAEALAKANEDFEDWESENSEELKELESLLDELQGYGGNHQWRGNWYPHILIADSYFEEFAQEEAESLDLIDANASWPYTCIDWKQAAEELQQDYSSVEFDGDTYYYQG